jgi:hypothetical protein
VNQQQHLQGEIAVRESPWYQQLSHLLLRADPALWQDTLHNYGYVVPSNRPPFSAAWRRVCWPPGGDLLLGLLLLPFRSRQRVPRHGLR